MSRQHREHDENLTPTELMGQLKASILIALRDNNGPMRLSALIEFLNSSGGSVVTDKQVWDAVQELCGENKISDSQQGLDFELTLVQPKRVKKLPRDIRKGDRIALIAGSSDHFGTVTFIRKLTGAWAGWYRIQYTDKYGRPNEDKFRSSDALEVEAVS